MVGDDRDDFAVGSGITCDNVGLGPPDVPVAKILGQSVSRVDDRRGLGVDAGAALRLRWYRFRAGASHNPCRSAS